MTPRVAERWRRQKAPELGLTGPLTSIQRDLLRHLEHFAHVARHAEDPKDRAKGMTAYQRTIDRLIARPVRRGTPGGRRRY